MRSWSRSPRARTSPISNANVEDHPPAATASRGRHPPRGDVDRACQVHPGPPGPSGKCCGAAGTDRSRSAAQEPTDRCGGTARAGDAQRRTVRRQTTDADLRDAASRGDLPVLDLHHVLRFWPRMRRSKTVAGRPRTRRGRSRSCRPPHPGRSTAGISSATRRLLTVR